LEREAGRFLDHETIYKPRTSTFSTVGSSKVNKSGIVMQIELGNDEHRPQCTNENLTQSSKNKYFSDYGAHEKQEIRFLI